MMDALNFEEILTSKHQLRFHDNGRFRILMMSDIHLHVEQERRKIKYAMQAMIDGAAPDLVLLGGDITHAGSKEQLQDLLDDITAPMENAGIPWAHVYGNHDSEMGLTKKEQQKIYETYPHCISKAGVAEGSGVGNYVLPIWNSSGDKILFNVFGMDSHRDMKEFSEEFGLPVDTEYLQHRDSVLRLYGGCVHFEQIMWYWQTSKALEEYTGNRIPALMYMHVPLPEMKLISMNQTYCKCDGIQLEEVADSPLNSGLFAACIQRGDVKGIFFGHDHVNDFIGQYCGITMGYDAFMCYGTYGRNELRGGRIFDLTAEAPDKFYTHMLRLRSLVGHSGDDERE